MTRATKLKWRYGLVGAAILIGLLVLFAALSGCSVGRSLDDGTPMVGVRLGDEAVTQAASTIGGVVGGIFGGPAGAATGASLAGAVAAGIWGLRRGERRGWDEAAETIAGKPATVPVAGAGGPSSRVGPTSA